MKRLFLMSGFFLALSWGYSQIKPSEAYPHLFDTVQRSGIFADSKTFPDSKPLYDIDSIRRQYQRKRSTPQFNLKAFVANNFDTATHVKASGLESHSNIINHIESLWPVLTREDKSESLNRTSRIRVLWWNNKANLVTYTKLALF